MRKASKLDKVREQRHVRDSDHDAEMRGRGMAYGMRMATELVAAVIVGGLIGYALDWWLGTKPWLFLLFFVLGFAAGVLNVLRAYERMQKEFKTTSIPLHVILTPRGKEIARFEYQGALSTPADYLAFLKKAK